MSHEHLQQSAWQGCEAAKDAGNPQFVAPPWLPYRLLYAYRLAEYGHISQATAYCMRLGQVYEKLHKPPPGIMVAKALTTDLAARLSEHAKVGPQSTHAGIASMASEAGTRWLLYDCRLL